MLRPGMLEVIEGLEFDAHAGRLGGALVADGKRLKPCAVVAEFDKYLHDEIDLVREAANAAQLKPNMAGLNLVLVPRCCGTTATAKSS